uniref:Peptidase C83 domain-containing protein n=1 Tax=Clytia hemisphaerica TaxID=252671 RepID=A0A7M5XKI1_9CNID
MAIYMSFIFLFQSNRKRTALKTNEPIMSTLPSAPMNVLSNVNVPGIILFNSEDGLAKFQESTLKHAMFNNSEYYKMIPTKYTNRDAQTALVWLFNALQFTINFLIANYPPRSQKMNDLYASFETYDADTNPVLIKYGELIELRNVIRYFRNNPLTPRGLTMLDMRNLIVTAQPFMAVRHYASPSVVHHGPVDRDNVTLDSTQTMMKGLLNVDIKWQGVGFLAFMEISDIWPGLGEGHVVAAVAAVNGRHVLLYPTMVELFPLWVRDDILYQAMSKIDKRDGKQRGLIEIYLNLP